MNNYAHCESCDAVINTDIDNWELINDNTYCEICSMKE